MYGGEISLSSPIDIYQATGKCFSNITFTIEATSPMTFDLTVNLQGQMRFACMETILIANTEIAHIETFAKEGAHVMSFTVPDNYAEEDYLFGGVKAYLFCEDLIKSIESVLRTLEAFVGGLSDHPLAPIVGSHVPGYMEKENINFLSEAMEYQMEPRTITDVHIDEDLIQSGDAFIITRLDGLDPVIMWASGSRAGHCVMALRFDGDLYMVESQDAWYWPTNGLQRTPYKQWLKQAKEASFNVVWLPLSGKSLLKFDEKAAQDWFHQTEGLPYGYHNFLFGWLDTSIDNLPPLVPNEGLPIVLSMLNRIIPEKIQVLFLSAMNKRLGTEGLTFEQVAALAAERDMEVQDLMAQPEQDGWMYTGEEPRDGLSFVCSSYVSSFYKVAGLYDGHFINATEQTPRDLYMLDVFEKNFKRPQACVDADPNLSYCQMMGNYRIDLDGYSTIKPYDYMNEACPSVAPLYYRPEGC